MRRTSIRHIAMHAIPTNSSRQLPEWLDQRSGGIENIQSRDLLIQFSRPFVEEYAGRAWAAVNSAERYLQRIWQCLAHHGPRFAENDDVSLERVLERLVQGDLGYQRPQSNIVRDLCLAQALELQENEAARRFEHDWMPLLRRMAFRVAGQRGEEAVENFLAELILPRQDHAPRIASYLGKTSLQSWLSAVVTNHCHSRGRKRQEKTMEEEIDPAAPALMIDLPSDQNRCSDLLQPVFSRAVSSVPAEDRLLLQFLVIDEVPQQEVARTLGIHTGNVTRRRQRATARIWEEIQLQTNEGEDARQVQNCLELVLAGNNRELQQTLGGVLANALPRPADEEAPS
ncbi:MAG: RNA polymerase sigma factor [Planctomycetaceae bacterium]